MSKHSKQVFEMLVRVLVFRTANKDLIAKSPQVDQLLQKVEAAMNRIADLAALQTSGSNGIRLFLEKRTSAREDLRKELESIARTAASMGLGEFFLPRERTDRAIASVARSFVTMAEPIKEDFLANHVPPDFIERLKTGVEIMEGAFQKQVASKSTRRGATAGLVEAEDEVLTTLARLDPLMDNLLRDNEPVKAAWAAARHVAKTPGLRKPTEPPPLTPPVTPPADKAA